MCEIYRDPIYIIDRNANNFEGIISEEALINAQERICDAIRYPTTVIENYRCLDKNEQTFERFDSIRSTIIFCKACEAYRLVTKSIPCFQCDDTHAGILFNYENEIINGQKENVQQYINANYGKTIYLNDMTFHVNEPPIYTEKWVGKNKLRYLRYSCPMTGLTELIFPLIVGNHIVGVLFVGQLILLKNKKNIHQARSKLINANRNRIQEHIRDTKQKAQLKNEKGTKFLLRIQQILKSPKRCHVFHRLKQLSDPTDEYLSFDPQKYKEKQKKKRQFQDENDLENYIIQSIHPQINNFADFLQKQLLLKQKQYIQNSIQRHKKELKQHSDQLIADEHNVRENTAEDLMRRFWTEVKTILHDIQNEFNLANIEIYLYNPNSTKRRFRLECSLVTDEKNISVDLSDEEWNKYANHETLMITDDALLKKFGVRNQTIASAQYESILNQKYISILTHHKNICQFPSLKEPFREYIAQLITTIMHELAIIKNTADTLLTIRILRLYRHEISHLNLGLSAVNRNLKDPEALKALPTDRISAIHTDFSSCLQLLSFMTKNIGIFTGSLSRSAIKLMEVKALKIFKQMIWKWETLYQDELKKRGLSIIAGREDPASIKNIASRPYVKSNPEMLELIIYNIVNNAIKYAHDGSRIYIDCDVSLEDDARQSFTVIDYGQGMTEDPDLPYELYYRDSNLDNSSISGNGIGLHISKQAADYIGAKIQHSVLKISDYYTPFIQRYLALTEGPFPVDQQMVQTDWDQKEPLYQKTFNPQSCKEFTDQQIRDKIKTPTYEVKFEVIL